jgi:comEA protein
MIRWLIGLTLAYLTGMTPGMTPGVTLLVQAALPAVQEPAHSARSSRSSSDAKPLRSTQVNINTATAEELDGLPGIGPRMARRIIAYRQKNGPFKKLEDLMGVQGIGEKNFLKLKPLITIAPPKAEHTGTAQP